MVGPGHSWGRTNQCKGALPLRVSQSCPCLGRGHQAETGGPSLQIWGWDALSHLPNPKTKVWKGAAAR